MNLSEYRLSENEQKRTRNLLALMPKSGRIALDIGARDGHFSRLLAERFDKVIALDLVKPNVSHPKVQCLQGNVAELPLADDAVDFVFCTEVLEHLRGNHLLSACQELQRVCSGRIMIGVPYRQDLRVGRTTCYSCRKKNPPWGHVNQFDDTTLISLFRDFSVEAKRFVGITDEHTNALATMIMDLAGNPYGTYDQEETCIHCDRKLLPPPQRTLMQRILTRTGHLARRSTARFAKPHANWIHVLFAKGVTMA